MFILWMDNRASRSRVLQFNFHAIINYHNMDISQDLGAGYSTSDKRVTKAIAFLEDKLKPFIEENPKLFKDSNFLDIKGYATNLGSSPTNEEPPNKRQRFSNYSS